MLSAAYLLDPSMPVRGLDLALHITGGGDGYDYPAGVVPATQREHGNDGTTLRWRYDALEAGVPVGAILPSEKGYDQMIATLIVRAAVPFGLFFAGLVVLGIVAGRPLRVEQTALLCAAWMFFYVLLPYFAAFVHFYVAYVVALALVGALVVGYASRVLGPVSVLPVASLWAATQLTPTFAVLLEGYTGLVYTLEILAALALAMWATTRPGFGQVLEGLRELARPAIDGGAS